MKKVLAILLVIILVFSLSACGGKTSSRPSSTNTPKDSKSETGKASNQPSSTDNPKDSKPESSNTEVDPNMSREDRLKGITEENYNESKLCSLHIRDVIGDLADVYYAKPELDADYANNRGLNKVEDIVDDATKTWFEDLELVEYSQENIENGSFVSSLQDNLGFKMYLSDISEMLYFNTAGVNYARSYSFSSYNDTILANIDISGVGNATRSMDILVNSKKDDVLAKETFYMLIKALYGNEAVTYADMVLNGEYTSDEPVVIDCLYGTFQAEVYVDDYSGAYNFEGINLDKPLSYAPKQFILNDEVFSKLAELGVCDEDIGKDMLGNSIFDNIKQHLNIDAFESKSIRIYGNNIEIEYDGVDNTPNEFDSIIITAGEHYNNVSALVYRTDINAAIDAMRAINLLGKDVLTDGIAKEIIEIDLKALFDDTGDDYSHSENDTSVTAYYNGSGYYILCVVEK